MPSFKRNGNRLFWKLTDKGTVIRVINTYYSSIVEVTKNAIVIEDVFGKDVDTRVYKECSEEEFNKARSEAMDNIMLERI